MHNRLLIIQFKFMPERKRSDRASDWDADPIVEWVLDEGRFSADLDDLVGQLGRRMLTSGAPVWRLRLAMRTLHPLVTAVTSTWEREARSQSQIESLHGLEGRPFYKGSPFEIIRRTREPFRKRLTAALPDTDHTSLHELKRRGCTDYFGLPLEFSDGAVAIMVIATDFEEGFANVDLAHFTKIASVLAPIIEVFSLRHISRAVAEAYLGARTGQRVLAGQITRGHIEKINAAILVSDIRDWTSLNNRIGSEAALALANRYFEAIAGAVEANGGEILKFMGDGVLAVFPTDNSLNAARVCENALTAGQQALQAAREADPPLDLHFGIGMHVGEVLYGNIGSLTRIDFTVLGQAVNVAARIEALCRKFDRPILFSQTFADLLDAPAELVARQTLKGEDSASSILTTREDP